MYGYVYTKNFTLWFKEIVDEERIKKAKELLLNSEYSFTEISQRVGYFDLSHMSRDFNKNTGLTPGKWKEVHIKL